MTTITIPKKLVREEDLIIVPRWEYEALLKFKEIKEFTPTATQRRSLRRAERNLKLGKTLSYHELVKKLGFGN